MFHFLTGLFSPSNDAGEHSEKVRWIKVLIKKQTINYRNIILQCFILFGHNGSDESSFDDRTLSDDIGEPSKDKPGTATVRSVTSE